VRGSRFLHRSMIGLGRNGTATNPDARPVLIAAVGSHYLQRPATVTDHETPFIGERDWTPAGVRKATYPYDARRGRAIRSDQIIRRGRNRISALTYGRFIGGDGGTLGRVVIVVAKEPIEVEKLRTTEGSPAVSYKNDCRGFRPRPMKRCRCSGR
jgi:hypothetical protein